ncbi:hypothetical protein AruPA_07080 [Acidiphilium sp. PA]|nr:hypothetical protein [Acidiphilium sp. PA]MCW8306795.1 hypothetical protein [Acidiphilium sp. PA]
MANSIAKGRLLAQANFVKPKSFGFFFTKRKRFPVRRRPCQTRLDSTDAP